MEIPVSAMPKFLRNDVLKERKKLLESGKISEDVADMFHLFSDDLQIRLLDFAESRKKGQVTGMGEEFDYLAEYEGYKPPTDDQEKIEAVRIAFTTGTLGSRARVAETIEEAAEAKNTMEKAAFNKSKEEVKRESVIGAFTSRPIVEETK